MIDNRNSLTSITDKNSEQLRTMAERIFAAAQPGAVYSEPVVSGNYTIITASEVSSGGGFGSGMGFGPTTPSTKRSSSEGVSQAEQDQSGGGGIGVGGGSAGRPVAVIIIGPDGATVKPVFDFTKIVLAGITAWTTMLVVLRKARKASKG
ncbi:MAG TPA: hypothetical protein VEV19_04215 [Ktedonobacteraceae bacterium]|nr:hypothetical protein [Ktedonobacteraceae bacterium]